MMLDLTQSVERSQYCNVESVEHVSLVKIMN